LGGGRSAHEPCGKARDYVGSAWPQVSFQSLPRKSVARPPGW
jgi:hypothetical protein